MRPANPEALAFVAQIVGEATGTHAEITARGTVTASTRGDEALAAIVAGLDSAGIAVTELSLHLPSLDEVFSALTRKETGGRVFEEVAA